MSMLLQQLVVGVLVLGCALFSAWRLSSLRLRLRVLAALEKLPAGRALPGLARLRERTLARQLSACGGCGQAPTQGAASPNQTPGALRR